MRFLTRPNAQEEPESPSDDELVLRAISGEKHAFEQIMRRYNQRGFRIARGYLPRDEDAMDALQEAYIQAFTHLQQYAGNNKFSAWIGKIIRNEALMHLRRHKNVTYMSHETLDSFKSEKDEMHRPLTKPERRTESQEIRELIENAISLLSPEFRLVFILRGVEQLSIEETSEITGIEAATVKTRYHRARKLIQRHIQKQLDMEELEAFSFAGHRCDHVVHSVLNALS